MHINLLLDDGIANVTVGGVTRSFPYHRNQFNTPTFKSPVCAVIMLSEDGPEIVKKIEIFNGNSGYHIGVFVDGEIYRNPIGVRWSVPEDFRMVR